MKQFVYERPFIYPKQLAAIFDPARYSVIEATTKAGKTLGCIIWLTEKALAGREGDNFWWVAPIFSQAKIAYRRVVQYLPRDIGLYKANDTELSIFLANGARISFKGSDNPNSLYGDDVTALVIDEASRCKEETWAACRSTLTATRGHARIIGNVKGKKNWAYKMARMAEAGEKDMAYHRLTALDAIEGGIFSQEELEDAKRQLPPHVFQELYLAKAADDGGNPFGIDAIERCVKPLSNFPPVCFGVDLAKSVDWTVAIGLDKFGEVCRFERWQKPWLVTIEDVASHVKSVCASVDSTGVGDPILEALQKKGPNYEGYKFSSSSKQQLMEGLAVAIQRSEIKFPDGLIKAELEIFEYQYTRTGVRYSAPDGFHDDCVCALALAWYKFKNRSDGLINYYQAMVVEEKKCENDTYLGKLLNVNRAT